MSPIPSSKMLTVSSACEHKQIAANNNNATTFLNCHITAPACDESDRKPIDLVVVLDRSGSMAGSKLTLCKKTMEFLAKELSAQDRVALVSYDSYVTTDLRLTKMTSEGKSLLASRVNAIQAGSCTNLSGGLLAGLDEIQQPRRADNGEPNPVQSVLLLTDGLANEGISSKSGLVNMLEGALSKSVSLFTFGYGSDHDADLLRQLSDLGRGSYYFVQSLDGVSLAFADCLGGLLSVVAQNIKVECVAMSPNVSIASIKTKRPITTIKPSAHYEVDLGDMYGQEERDVLVQVTLTESLSEDVQSIVEFKVRYANVLTSTLEHLNSVVSVARPSVVTDTTLDALVVQQKHRIETAEAIEAAQREASRGNLKEGRDMLHNLKTKMKKDVQALALDENTCQQKSLMDDLDECCSVMANVNIYRSRGEQRMAGKTQSHWAQRSNDIEVNEEELMETTCAPGAQATGGVFGFAQMFAAPASMSAAPAPMSAAPAPMKYRSEAKKKMMSRAFNFISSSKQEN